MHHALDGPGPYLPAQLRARSALMIHRVGRGLQPGGIRPALTTAPASTLSMPFSVAAGMIGDTNPSSHPDTAPDVAPVCMARDKSDQFQAPPAFAR